MDWIQAGKSRSYSVEGLQCLPDIIQMRSDLNLSSSNFERQTPLLILHGVSVVLDNLGYLTWQVFRSTRRLFP